MGYTVILLMLVRNHYRLFLSYSSNALKVKQLTRTGVKITKMLENHQIGSTKGREAGP